MHMKIVHVYEKFIKGNLSWGCDKNSSCTWSASLVFVNFCWNLNNPFYGKCRHYMSTMCMCSLIYGARCTWCLAMTYKTE